MGSALAQGRHARAGANASEYSRMPHSPEEPESGPCSPEPEPCESAGPFGTRSYCTCLKSCPRRRCLGVALATTLVLVAARGLYIVWAVNNACTDLAYSPTHGGLENVWYSFFPVYVTCPSHSTFDRKAVAEAVSFVPVRNARDDAVLIGKLRSWLDHHKNLTCCQPEYQFHEQAYGVLARIADVNARDILAFRETWSELDTQLLLGLDGRKDGFVPGGPLTRDSFAERLPKAEGFAKLVETPGRVAMVGSGGVLRDQNMGPIIDEHSQVVRFNDLVGNKLTVEDTGLKTTIHVSCSKVDTLQNATIAEFDMESAFPWVSYCNRMYTNGVFFDRTVPYLIRPSAYCALGYDIRSFTRGFVFYWFIGRLFEGVDFYGFGGSDHFQKQKPAADAVVHEEFLKFEHLVYELAMG